MSHSWYSNAKPNRHYRLWLHPSIQVLYDACSPWPSGRSKKRDSMIEELRSLQSERTNVPDPQYCVFELYDRAEKRLKPCGKLQDGFLFNIPLCFNHLLYAKSMPEDSLLTNSKPKDFTYRKLETLWFSTFGHVAKPKKVRI